MENATKGLMIAGAILIAIVLIGIGVFLVSQAQNWITRGGQQFSDMEVSAFNSQFENYESRQSGSNIRALITAVNSNNMTAATEGTYAEKGIKVTFESSITSLVIDGTVEGYTASNATQARTAINTGKTYYVAFGYDNTSKLIDQIGIATTQDAANGLIQY